VAGLPAGSTLAFDEAGALYLARTGRRYLAGEGDDLYPVYRIPPGGGTIAASAEQRHHHGPPLRNPQVATVRGGRELFLTTFDRDRRIGVIYRMRDGRAELFAGGTPLRGQPPVVRQPEGAAFDSQGRLYVADRDRGRILQLDPAGRVLDPAFATMTRPRLVAVDDEDHVWVGADADAQAPWQQGPGEIWRIAPGGTATLVLRGPVAAGMDVAPGGVLFVADRHAARIFALTPDGRRTDFAQMSEGDAPRGLAFAPDTAATRRLGIAGDLFVIAIPRGAWMLNRVLHVSGPLADWVRHAVGP
jgi:sugar lactone lactonase YvrE